MITLTNVQTRISAEQNVEGAKVFDVIFNYHETFGGECMIKAILTDGDEFYFENDEGAEEFLNRLTECDVEFYTDEAYSAACEMVRMRERTGKWLAFTTMA